jgi:hypothetical protein
MCLIDTTDSAQMQKIRARLEKQAVEAIDKDVRVTLFPEYVQALEEVQKRIPHVYSDLQCLRCEIDALVSIGNILIEVSPP